jgi:uncharacterized protein (TIGR02266 family)
MRVRLKYTDVQSFVERFASNISRQGIFIASKSPKPVGTPVRFELLLADGKSRLIRGEGVVSWVREYDAAQPGRPHGMGVKFSRLDGESQRLIERIEQFKLDRQRDAAADSPSDDGEGAPLELASDESTGPHAAGSLSPAEPEAVPRPVSAAASPVPATIPPQIAPTSSRPATIPPRPRTVASRPPTLPPAAAQGLAPALRMAEPALDRDAAALVDADLAALLDADGDLLERSLSRAREIARSLAADGLDDLHPGGLDAWLEATREESRRLAQQMLPARPAPIAVAAAGRVSARGDATPVTAPIHIHAPPPASAVPAAVRASEVTAPIAALSKAVASVTAPLAAEAFLEPTPRVLEEAAPLPAPPPVPVPVAVPSAVAPPEPKAEASVELDLTLELEARTRLVDGIALCRAKKDEGTRALLTGILEAEEEGIDWLETQLHVIGEIGIERYLAEKL